MASGIYYVAGIDSGSTSTDVVILNQNGKIKSTMIIPTGGGAMLSAEKSLDQAVEKAGIRKEDIVRIVTTGYGRAYIDSGDDSVTEITCHAKGAHYLNPNVRTVIDIGGQDIKAIRIDENGQKLSYERQMCGRNWKIPRNDGKNARIIAGRDEREGLGMERKYCDLQYVYGVCGIRSGVACRPE